MNELTKHLVERIENIDWESLSPTEQTLVFRALTKSARNWQVSHGLQPDYGSVVARQGGYCHFCRQQAIFVSNDAWLRDHYVCTTCWSLPRQRNVMRALDELIPAWPLRSIHESSPSNMRLAELCPEYSHSQYLPETPPGTPLANGGTCQNLEALTFPDESFDVFVTQDVLEHVFHPDVAVREIMRVLRPGGWHLFTAPRLVGLEKTRRRARLDGDKVIHLIEPQYHGNPVGDGKSLVTFDYGLDFESLLENWAEVPVITLNEADPTRGIDGESFEVFAIRKQP